MRMVAPEYDGTTPYYAWFDVYAESDTAASNIGHGLTDAGPGSEVPGSVVVHALVESHSVGPGLSAITASGTGRFETFRVLFDADVNADLETHENVSVTALPNGWVSVTTIVPDPVFGMNDELILELQEAHSDESFAIELGL